MTPLPRHTATPPLTSPLREADLAALLAVARVVALGGRVLVVNTTPAAGRLVARVAATLARVAPGAGVVWAPGGWVAGLLSNWRAASRGLAAYAQYAGGVAGWAARRGVSLPLVRAARRRYGGLVARHDGATGTLPWRAAPDLVVALGAGPGAHMARECRAMGVPLVHLADARGAALLGQVSLALGRARVGARGPAAEVA